MTSFADWCKVISQKYNAPVTFIAYPASFDWTFVYWYFVHTGVTSPFGFSRVLDLKSVFAAKTGKPITKSTKRNMPKHLFSKLPHTHRADDDAIEQGILGINLLNWKPSA